VQADSADDQAESTVDDSHELIYLVQPGDSLWQLAERFYGDGREEARIFDANVGRPQPGGRSLNRHAVIYPGWRLRIPAVSETASDASVVERWYTVQKGDTMTGIAARELGDPTRWRELFELNRGASVDGFVLTNPSLIWPGLRLRLPLPADDDGSSDSSDASAGVAPKEPAPPEPAPPVQADEPTSVPPAQPTPMPPTPTPTAAPTSVPTATSAPVVVSVAPTPTAAAPIETVTPAEETSAPARSLELPPWAAPVAARLAGVALIGAGVGTARRGGGRDWRSESDVEVRAGFAEAAGDEPDFEARAAALAEQVLAFVHEHGCPSVRLVGAYAGRTGGTLLLHVDLAEAERLAEAAAVFGPSRVRLTGADRYVTGRQGPGDVQWEQYWSRPRPHLISEGNRRASVELVPIGLAGDRRVLFAAWDALGALLVAGQDAAAAHAVQNALVVDLARRQPPASLQLLTIARSERLEPLLADLPQQRLGFVDPADAAAVADVFAYLSRELNQRLAANKASSWPELVVVVDEWAELAELGSILDELAQHGPGAGIRLLAATSQVSSEELPQWASLFRTRLVLEVPDAQSSIWLLGEERAEDLDRGGELWPYFNGRIMPRVRGFRVPSDHVQHLVAEMSARLVAHEAPSTMESTPPDGVAPSSRLIDQVPATGQPATNDRPEVPDDTGRQLPLIRAVPLPAHESAPATPRVHIQVLGGHAILVDGETVPEPRYRRAWELLALVACLPPGEALRRRIVELVWPAAAEDGELSDRQLDGRLRTALSQLKEIWRAHLSDDEVDRLWRSQGGVIRLDDQLVGVDLHAFLAAAQAGDRAWRPPRGESSRPVEAIAHYRQALAIYTGPLLAGREQAYAWVPEIQERATRRQREVSHHLAVVLQNTGQYAEAAGLWADLIRDPGPPDSERDHGDQYAYREACARAAFECCRQLRDHGRLLRVHQELLAVLAALDDDADAAEPVHLAPATIELYETIDRELTTATDVAVGET
jgi:hypothetical protein